jgi:hypothetical protein
VTNKVVIALIIMALVALVLIFTHGTVRIDLVVTEIKPITSLALLIFMALGVIVGLLLKGG